MKKNLLLSAALLFGIILGGNNVYAASEDAPVVSSTAIKSSNSSHLDYLPSTMDNTVRRNYQRANPQYSGELTIMTRDQYREYLKDGVMRKAPSLNDTLKKSISNQSDPITPFLSQVNSTAAPFVSMPNIVMYWYASQPGIIVRDWTGNGTGFKISGSRAGTAGHVVYDKELGLGWVKEASAMFGLHVANGILQPVHTAAVDRLITNTNFQNAPSLSLEQFKWDYGALVLNFHGSSQPANLPMQVGPAGNVNLVRAAGYPVEAGWDGTKMVMTNTASVHLLSGGDSLIYGSVDSGEVLKGMSGGPLYTSAGKVIGITSGAKNGEWTWTRLTSGAINTITNG